jgi:tRNA pseudouridine38-40 synthase
MEKWAMALNSLLPDDLSVLSVEKAKDTFHARYDAIGKEYRYYLQMSSVRDPFQRNYAYQYPYKLDLETIKEASQYLIGTYDFTSFCSAKTEIEDRIRTINAIEITLEGDKLCFRFVGNGFLYNMVRILVGTLLEVGTGDRLPSEIPDIIDKRDRRFAGKTAPGHGLYLWKVFYK